ncbi:MAG: hypothetical protein AAFX02_10890 [Pseudomonadota bacterium]
MMKTLIGPALLLSIGACASIASTTRVADNLALFVPAASESEADIAAAEQVRLCAAETAEASWSEARFRKFSRSLSIYATSQLAEIRRTGPYLVTEEFLRLDVTPNDPAPRPQAPTPALLSEITEVGVFVAECENRLNAKSGY